MSVHNPAANAFNALTASTQFGQQQQDRQQAQQLAQDQQGLVNTQNKIALALAPGGAGREQAQQLATSSGDASILGALKQQFDGLDAAETARGLQSLQTSAGAAIQMLSMPENQREAWLRGIAPTLGFDPEAAIRAGLTDANIQSYVGAISAMDAENFQSRTAPITLTSGQSRFDPVTGRQVESVSSRLDRPIEQQGADTSRIGALARRTTAQTGVAREARESVEAPGVQRGESFTQERQLRQEFTGITSDFRDIQNNISVIRSVAERGDAQGDLALVVAFTKLLDPGSVAREGEVSLTQSTASTVQQAGNWLNRLRDGNTVLPAEVRAAFVSASEDLAGEYNKAFNLRADEFSVIATDFGLDPNRVIVGRPAARPVDPIAPVVQGQGALTQDELAELAEREAVDLQTGGQ